MKEAVDMTPEEYKKFIFNSGVSNNDHGGGKIITMNADGSQAINIKSIILFGGFLGAGGAVLGAMFALSEKETGKKLLINMLIGFATGAVVGGTIDLADQKLSQVKLK